MRDVCTTFCELPINRGKKTFPLIQNGLNENPEVAVCSYQRQSERLQSLTILSLGPSFELVNPLVNRVDSVPFVF